MVFFFIPGSLLGRVYLVGLMFQYLQLSTLSFHWVVETICHLLHSLVPRRACCSGSFSPPFCFVPSSAHREANPGCHGVSCCIPRAGAAAWAPRPAGFGCHTGRGTCSAVRGRVSLLLPLIPVLNPAGAGSLCLPDTRDTLMPKWSVAFCLFEKQALLSSC